MMNDKKKMLLDWMRKVHQLEYAHCYQSIYFSKLEKFIGISAFALSTLVAFSYRFPDVNNDFFNTYLFFLKKEYSIPFLSLIIALFTGLQTFLKPSEKAENHKKIGFNYEKLRHNIEMVLTIEEDEVKLDEKVSIIKKEWDELNSVYVSNRYFLQGKEKVKNFNKYPKELDFLPDIALEPSTSKTINILGYQINFGKGVILCLVIVVITLLMTILRLLGRL